MNGPLVDSKMASLRTQLDKAELKLAEAKKTLRAAERKEESASNTVYGLREDIALEQLRQWGNNPDLSALMESGRDSTMIFYQALGAIAEAYGFGISGHWADTNQTSLRFGLNRSEIGAIERIAQGILYFAPAMKPIKGAGGWVRFAVNHRESSSCAWELRYSKKNGATRLVRQVHGHIEETLDFKTLHEALRHVEQHLWCENVIDADTAAVLEC